MKVTVRNERKYFLFNVGNLTFHCPDSLSNFSAHLLHMFNVMLQIISEVSQLVLGHKVAPGTHFAEPGTPQSEVVLAAVDDFAPFVGNQAFKLRVAVAVEVVAVVAAIAGRKRDLDTNEQ